MVAYPGQSTSRNGGALCQELALIRLFYPIVSENILNVLPDHIRHRIEMLFVPKWFSLRLKDGKTGRSESISIFRARLFPSGANASTSSASADSKSAQDAGGLPFFPPEVVMEVKALACQLPKDMGLPFSRLSHEEIARETVARGIVASISGATVWRWLSADAIRPWCYRSWLWPRDPHFEEKAGPVLDLLSRHMAGSASGTG